MGDFAYSVSEMIAIPINYFFGLYIGTIILIILLSFIYNRSPGKILVKDKNLFCCPVCAYRYIINDADKIHKCPQCESLNTKAA